MGNSQTRKKSALFESDYYMLENEDPVYENHELGVLNEGICFAVTGIIALTCQRFFINFLVDNEAGDIALHLNARLPHNYIVRNSRVNKRWRKEQNSSSLPLSLSRGKKIVMQILVTDDAFLISVNGYHYAAYIHYIPYTLITSLSVKGELTNVTMKHSRVSIYPERFGHIGTVAIIHQSSVVSQHARKLIYANETSMAHKWNLSIELRALKWQEEIPSPYIARIPRNTMKPGRFLKIEGRVKLLPTSFYINLQKNVYYWPPPVVAFHLGPRFSNKCENISRATIVRCAWYDGAWSPEERSDIDTEFLPGKAFRLAIVCEEDAYEVYLNGKYLLDFKYHMRPEVVDTVYIRGDVKLRWVSLHSNTQHDGDILEYFSPKRRSLVKQRLSNKESSQRNTYADA